MKHWIPFFVWATTWLATLRWRLVVISGDQANTLLAHAESDRASKQDPHAAREAVGWRQKGVKQTIMACHSGG